VKIRTNNRDADKYRKSFIEGLQFLFLCAFDICHLHMLGRMKMEEKGNIEKAIAKGDLL
jgi:hypothetical protein